ncbi:MAG TPA: 3-hydroxyacyl-ACP dehydratase FabZ [Sneathiellales bacterium]|nr:3-hydroxyacyl-ACP dehydratase FabZ [Sneathiellales bacterium]
MTEVETIHRLETADIARVMEMLPHRYPMLLVDRVVGLDPGVCAIGIKNVSINEHYFQGHFPSQAVMPGVLIVEAMAQTAAVVVVAGMGPSEHGQLVYFMSIEGARFRKPVQPGDQLHLHVEKVKNRRNVWKFKGEAKVDGILVAEATFTAMIVDDESDT